MLPDKVDGKYPAFSLLGNYPLFYVDEFHNALCASCASLEDEYTPVEACEVRYEDHHVFCDDCSVRIPPAYGDE